MLGALIAGVLFALVLLGWARKDHTGLPGIRTTRSANVEAALVCYVLFERLGVSVGRAEEPLLADMLSETDVLFLLDPIIPIHLGELRDARTWLLDGGVLVCTEVPKGLYSDVDASGKAEGGLRTYCATQQESGSPEALQTTSVPVGHRDLPLARDVSNVYFETLRTVDANLLDSNGPGNAFEPLLFDTCGLRAAGHKLGRGHLIIVSDSSFLANGQIGKGDNSILAVNLVSYALSLARGRRVAFDEYHLGGGHHETGIGVLGWMLFTTPAGWSVLSLTAAGVLFMIYEGRRFGPRHGLERERRRSKVEYIYAVGSTYRSAGANRLALELIFGRLKRDVIDLTGLGRKASNGAVAARLSHRIGLSTQRCKEVCDRCDEFLARPSLSERQLRLALNQLAKIEMEVFNERRKRK